MFARSLDRLLCHSNLLLLPSLPLTHLLLILHPPLPLSLLLLNHLPFPCRGPPLRSLLILPLRNLLYPYCPSSCSLSPLRLPAVLLSLSLTLK